ncbi:alpha/beta fold hydrolase [Aestuariispira insulae]|nr:alpha/beta hydrolase [Aestuariispira insulae]
MAAGLNGHQTTFLDLGFFREQSAQPIPAVAEGAVFVGHSLGFLWGLQNVLPRIKAIVAINGFTKFCSSDDHSEGVPVRVLSRMIRGLETNPDRVVSDFLKKCGGSAEPERSIESDRLFEGLCWLRDWDGRAAFRDFDGDFLALASKNDPIVPPKLTQDSFQGKEICWHEEAGHLLPLSHPDWCAQKTSEFLDQL